jgi:hypothetical protein
MKHRRILWKSCVLMLCLAAGWQTLVGRNGIRPRPSAARPYVQGAAHILQGGQASYQSRKADSGAALAGKPAVSYAKLPLSFEANQGQTDKRVKFLASRADTVTVTGMVGSGSTALTHSLTLTLTVPWQESS